MRKRLLLAAGALGVLLLSRPLLALEARAWSSPEARPALALSETMDAWARDPPEGLGPAPLGIQPGGALYEGEWVFATWMMAAAGHGQLGLQQPEQAALMAERASRAVDRVVTEESWAFDTAVWGDRALDHLDGGVTDHDHAVLGYLGVALGLERMLDPDNRHAELHDRLVAFLAPRLRDSPALATYPGRAYPVDHAASIATVALHARATGQEPPAWLQAHLDDYAARYLDERGLLVQAVAPGTGAWRSVGRGSGTALAAWFLGFADPALSQRLAGAIQAELATTELGIAAVREYAPATCAGGHACAGDVDSGPLILGTSVSATGFSLAAARRLDPAWFAELWATTRSVGAWQGDRFATGGPLGNAILFAMLTAPPLEGAEAADATDRPGMSPVRDPHER